MQAGVSLYHYYWIEKKLHDTVGLSEKKRKILFYTGEKDLLEEQSIIIENSKVDVSPVFSRKRTFLKLDLNNSVISESNQSNYGYSNRFA
jgi:hypothetical protein